MPEIWSGDILEVLLKRIIFHVSRLVVRRGVWVEIHGVVATTVPFLRFGEDYVSGVALACLYRRRVAVLPDRIVWMRTHEGQSYRNSQRLKENLSEAVDCVCQAFPDTQLYRSLVDSANLCHAA